jgi:shikimate kinase
MANIILIGFMGTGKSTIGRILAERLGYQFIDTDAKIEVEQGKTVGKIFETEGEAYFRDLEAKLAFELSANNYQVISTGGGFVLNPRNITVFKPEGTIVAFTAPARIIYERVKGDVQRPLLAAADPLARISELLLERAPFYQDADLIIETTDKKPLDLAIEIIEELTRRGLIHGRS